MRILTAEAMREVDRAAIEDFGVPSLVLMENAAIGLADAVADVFPDASSAAIFCGPGNNGGDGLALGRHLAVRGYHVELFLVTAGRELRGDALVQLNICRNQGLPMQEIAPDDSLRSALDTAAGLDLLVDALFGVGLKRPLQGQFAELVEMLNGLPRPRVAVDLPSGLNGSRWDIPGPHVDADLTVTFGAPKLAHIFAPAADAVGEVAVADLGVSPEVLQRAEGDLHLLVADELATELMPRPAASHKGDYGHVLLVAGSVGKSGAAVLAARAAVRSGAGLVTVAAPLEIVHTVDGASLESMTAPLPQTETGGLAPDAVRRVDELSVGKTVLAVGPGLGQDAATFAAVQQVVSQCELPLVLDADGLNALAAERRVLKERKAETVLTPHPGELGRLLGLTPGEVQSDRIRAVRQGAAEFGAIVVLKGYQTLVGTPDGTVFVNPTGNPGMASGGTGDVLTGLVAGLMSQRYEALSAALLGVFLHGLAGDLAAEGRGQPALAAGDLLSSLPGAFERLSQSSPW